MSKEYCQYILDQLSPLPHKLSSKPMFGGFGIYASGQIFAIVADHALYFKGDNVSSPLFEAYGSTPFAYEGNDNKRIVMSYWHVPEDIIEDDEMLLSWALEALKASERAEAKKNN